MKKSGNPFVRAMIGLVLAGFISLAPSLIGEAARSSGLAGFGVVDPYFGVEDCVSAEQRAEIRTLIDEYERRVGPGPILPQAGPQPYRFFPQAGTLWQDLYVFNFVDIDPSNNVRDWDCTFHTYNGHKGHDSNIRSFREQALGVPVFAVLDGVVVALHDGESDTNTEFRNQPSNYVVLDHSGGHRSFYFHLKKNSIAVGVNEVVKAGTQVGSTGSSGNSTWPHLHFESEHNGNVYEPSAGPCRAGDSRWLHQTPIRRDPYAYDFTFSDSGFSGDGALPFDANARLGTYVAGERETFFRFELGNLPTGSLWRVRFLRPDGSLALDGSGSFGNNFLYRRSWWWYTYNLNLNSIGTWRVLVDINDQTLIEAPFNVVSSSSHVSNRPPVGVGAVMDPPAPQHDDVIFCRVQTSLTARDPDYDLVSYRYRWTAGGRVLRDVTTAALSDALPNGLARPGEKVECAVTPFDGKVFGPQSTASATVGAPSPGPQITSAVVVGKKNLYIDGSGFGSSPTVLVNGKKKNNRIIGASDTSIRLKGKLKKLGLVLGVNTIEIVDQAGRVSNRLLLVR